MLIRNKEADTYQTVDHPEEQLAGQSVYHCHLSHQISRGQVLEEQSDESTKKK